MFRRKISKLVLCVILLTGMMGYDGMAYATETVKPTDIKRLLDAKQPEAAFKLAETLLDELEGDPEFDFFYGLAALESGRVKEAVLALERVTIAYPNNARVRIDYARALFLDRKFEQADAEFDLVLAQNPPAGVQATIKQFKQTIQNQLNASKYSVTGDIYIAFGADTNFNAASSVPSFQIPAFPGTDLPNSGAARKTLFSQTNISINLAIPSGRTAAWMITGSASNNSAWEMSTFDTNIVDFGVAYSFGGSKHRFQIPIKFSHLILDGHSSRDTVSVTGLWSYLFDQTTSLTGFVNASRGNDLNNQTPTTSLPFPWRDTNAYIFGVSASYKMNKTQFSHSGFWTDERPRGDTATQHGKNSIGLSLGISHFATERTTWAFSLFGQWARYDAMQPTFGVVRDDEMADTSLTVTYLATPKIALDLKAQYTQTDSNIVIYDYDRKQLKAGLRYRY